jgi:succinyl-CoA:acetate CoA-transferase
MTESSERVSERMPEDVPRLSATAAAAQIPSSATVGVSGFGSVGYPKAIPLALADSSRELSLTIASGGSVGDEIDTELVEADAIDRRLPFQAKPAIREAINDGTVAFQDHHISSLGDAVRYGGIADVDVGVVEAVAVGRDWLIPSTSIGHTPAYVAAADELFVEVNHAQPLGLQRLHDVYQRRTPPDRGPIPLSDPDERIGTPRIEFEPSKLVGVSTSDQTDASYSFRLPGETERAISRNLAAFLTREFRDNPRFAEHVYVQFGVGSIGNAMIEAIGSIDADDRTIHYFGEVFQDGLLDHLETGIVESASATSLALSEKGQQRLFAALDQYAPDMVVRPAAISNSSELLNRFGVVGINSALSVDLYGHANSTHLHGRNVVNGIGGSGDFNRNCPLAIVALPSTTGGGTSKIVPMVTHVDHTEHDIDVVITEQGVADVRGLSPQERAAEMISECAHPDVRPDLRAYLDRATTAGGHLHHDLKTAFDWR